ncbi:MAG: nucleotidyltransferase family protein, partial [Gammaproteobacteria bacterium]
MKAMLLAAGRGERMGALTAQQPKPLIEVGGQSLISRHLGRLHDAGVDDVVINLSYLGDQIREALGDVSDWGQRLRYSEEGEPALETAGGIIAALPLLGADPFVVVSADVYTDFDFATLDTVDAEGVLMLVPNPSHHELGDFGLSDDGIVSLKPPRLTFGGVAKMARSLFDGLSPGRRALRPVLEAAIHRAALKGVRYDGIWSDVGTPER